MYNYDNRGNILTVSKSGTLFLQYVYDEASQVKAEYNYAEKTAMTYVYDTNGNIVSKTPYTNVTNSDLSTATQGTAIVYGYSDSNWKDKLTAYGDTPITYDAIGNPLTYRGYTLTWQNGRQLASMKFRTINIGFTYDVDGLRTSKTIPNVGLEHKYYYVGNRLQYETLGGSSALWYFYDADGNPSGIRYKNGDSINDYYFVCNWRGDVIQIYNASGTLVGSYTYDAWGRVTENATSADTENITETNPIRYRGYYYDTETRLYYLKSRYYDPAVKRFLNVDGLVSTSIEDAAKNMFAYCTNNPVFYADSEGNCKYKANSYDFYRMNHGLPAAGCTCNTKKEPVKPDNNTGDSTAVVYTEKVIVPALKEILTSHANEILNGLILPQAALSPLLASKFETFLAGVSGIGLASILVVFHKIAWDGDRYENEIISLEDYSLSICITIGFTAFSAAAGAIIATAGMAVVPTIIVGVIAGVAIGAGEDYVRKKYGLPTTWY